MADKNRVKKRKDFTKVYQRGRSVAGRDLVLCFGRNKRPEHRVGFTVSKKVGNAVVRNKIRRRLKEITRLNPAMFKPGWDYIIIARHSVTGISYSEMAKELEELIKKQRS